MSGSNSTNQQDDMGRKMFHSSFSFEKEPERIKILILGSGFAGIQVLKRLQRKFRKNKKIDITLVSRDNFFLFTPMLPEVATGMIETRHIVTPVRTFLRTATFYEAEVESIDFNSKQVKISHIIGKRTCPNGTDFHMLAYDYLVLALGSVTNFFGMEELQNNCLTMSDIDDAIILRNHLLNILEQANIEKSNTELNKQLLTFVVVGGGFNGVETVGEVNDFVRETIKKYYSNVNMAHVRVVLVSAEDKILSHIDDKLGQKAMEKLKSRGVEFILKAQVKNVTENSVIIDNGDSINSFSVVWSAGVTPSKLISELRCEHDKHKRVVANRHLELSGYEGEVYALGDCASITDPNSGKPYPPTAQHALKQAEIAAHNIICDIEDKKMNKKKIDYKSRGMMAEIGKRYGVATLFGFKMHGFVAWWLWRTFYLTNLPTMKKKFKVMGDWTSDLFFSSDVAMIKRFVDTNSKKKFIKNRYTSNSRELKQNLN
jgi:NADH dehydrogenase